MLTYAAHVTLALEVNGSPMEIRLASQLGIE